MNRSFVSCSLRSRGSERRKRLPAHLRPFRQIGLIGRLRYRARLFFREEQYPWNRFPDASPRGPADDVAAAEKLFNECGYHLRDEELADAKGAILRR